ncbi:hypothetical protein GCM10022198_15180 [Klugiella xanthotipulae]|uniref:hypothetical protein n=1 Tax=Klugiella xanthotipulae TaxID=244735 RepID=UPI00114F8966|nr:hypothetical protein [Klugiella xanthotipulae]
MEIVETIPKDMVARVVQDGTGILLRCGETQQNWNGATTVTVVAGIEIETAIKAIENHYQNSEFTVGNRLDVSGHYEVGLVAPDEMENYLIGEDDPNTIRIDSGSTCFTLPEGVYPGGTF